MFEQGTERFDKRIIFRHRMDAKADKLLCDLYLEVVHKLKNNEFENYIDYTNYCKALGLTYYGQLCYNDHHKSLYTTYVD